MARNDVTITNLLNIYVITMPASFRLIVDELTHGTIYLMVLVVIVVNALSLSSLKNLLKSCCLDRFVTRPLG